MKIVCDSCATKYSISDDKVRGKVFKIRCKKCSHIIVVRGTADASAPAPSAAAPEGGGWHIVVEGEQVGPLPETDIRGRLSRGEINADTYIWKEGFADWLKLAAVTEFADAVSSSGAEVSAAVGGGNDFFNDNHSSPVRQPPQDDGYGQSDGVSNHNGGLFGGVDGVVASSAAVRPASGSVDVSDAFAVPAASSRGGGGDLFAAHAATPYSSDDGRRASAAPSNHDGGRVENLTAQRHENSVLFSLANLQSLAMPSGGGAAAKASAVPTSSSSSDGSGLIDIRAMAATTLGSPADSKSSSFGDDLPAFGSFSSAAPVLLQMPTSSGPPKWIYFVIGGMALLVVGIGAMAYKILTTKPVTVAAPLPPPVAAPAPVVAAPVPVAPAAAPAAPTIADENLPPREGAEKAAEAKHDHEKGEHGGEHGGKKGKNKDKKGGVAAESTGGGKTGGSAAVAAAAPAEGRPKPDSLDDLLNHATRSRARGSDDDAPSPRRGGGGSSDSAPASNGPLAKGAVVSGMNGVKPKISDCYNQFKVPGLAMVNVVIGKSGKVSSATVTGKFAGTPTGGCVEKAVKSASFPPSDGLSTPYPFSLK